MRGRNIRKGVLGVATLLVAFSALYWNYVIGAGMPLDAQFSYYVASCAVICMALGMVLATRPRSVETSFGGLDRMYRLHKQLGVAAMLLYVAHFVTVPGGPEPGAMAVATATEEGGATVLPAESAVPNEEEEVPVDLFGLMAMIGFSSLIIITLNRKIPYHRWFRTHRLMGVCYSILAIHVGLAFYDGGSIPLFSPPGTVLALFLIVGLGASAYRQVLRPRRGKHRFIVAAVNRLERATEVVLKPKDGMFPFEPGQFAFVTIDAAGFREAHPFTISSGATENELRFTMKVLGDYTRRVRCDLVEGAEAEVEGPYGRFNPLNGSEKQVWVAGGIGITPFLSVLRTMASGHGKVIRLYYCVRTAAEALFFDELEGLASDLGDVTIARFDSDAGARIDAQAIKRDLGGELGNWSFFLCGPRPMVAAVSEGLRKQRVSARRIHNEEFELR